MNVSTSASIDMSSARPRGKLRVHGLENASHELAGSDAAGFIEPGYFGSQARSRRS
jgi:hypothetical protein